MTVQQKRSLKVEKLARIYDEEIAPVWGTRFGKMLLRNLAVPDRGQVLDISCGTGYPTIEILRRMTDGSRLIAIDASSAMLDVARRKVADLGPLGKKGVFFRTESAVPKLSFADDVYDLVVCNLGLSEMPSLETALRDFARVCKQGGEVRCTLPLAGTFEEFHDLYREVLIKHDKHEALDRLDRHIARYPTVDHVERCMRGANLDGGLEIEEFTLLFKSSREFFFAPVIEYGPLAEWKEIAGSGQEMQDVFWYIKEAIDAYFDGRPFQVTVKAGCIVGKKLDANRAGDRRGGRDRASTRSIRRRIGYRPAAPAAQDRGGLGAPRATSATISRSRRSRRRCRCRDRRRVARRAGARRLHRRQEAPDAPRRLTRRYGLPATVRRARSASRRIARGRGRLAAAVVEIDVVILEDLLRRRLLRGIEHCERARERILDVGAALLGEPVGRRRIAVRCALPPRRRRDDVRGRRRPCRRDGRRDRPCPVAAACASLRGFAVAPRSWVSITSSSPASDVSICSQLRRADRRAGGGRWRRR